MRAAIVGGGLQGIEATYLAHKAGWEVLLIDKKPAPPAVGLTDAFIHLDITESGRLDTLFKNIDLVIPAAENREALDSLVQWNRQADIPLAFDAEAYAVSSSKLASDRLFARIGVPAPKPWPDCGFPLIAKPSGGSGSQGVRRFNHQKELEKQFTVLPPPGWVLQEYLEGPSYSLEVVGSPGNYTTFRVTDLEMDAGYDCKRVLAPTQLAPEGITQFERISVEIAEALGLKGLMDVEVILHNQGLKVLEIDARLPSQTPTVVYWSSGINLLEMLAQVFLTPRQGGAKTPRHSYWAAGDSEPGNSHVKNAGKAVIYEHINVSGGTLEVCGEHIMAAAGPLRLEPGFFGADEALTDYKPGSTLWAATLIITGSTLHEVREKQLQIHSNIKYGG